MVFNQVSAKAVIAKVFTDLDLQEENHREVDWAEWSLEALEKIGAYSTYNIKITGKEGLPLLEVDDYQTRIPADCVNVLGIQYSSTENGCYHPLRYGTSTFGARGEDSSTTSSTGVAPTTDTITWAMDLYDYTYEEALEVINTDPVLRTKLDAYIVTCQDNGRSCRNTNCSDDFAVDQYVYYINNNYIKLNVKSGYLKVAYQAISLDEEGYPMIPNDPGFFEALYWYINMKLLYPEWRRGSIRDAVYYDARSNWNYYCNQAYGKAMMPNADKLESLKNKWLQLYPEIHDHGNLFSDTGNQQLIYNK
jgi:hypothetical protein